MTPFPLLCSLKAGDLYGNSKLLPTGTRPKPRAKVNPPSGPAVISVQQQATAQAAKLDAAESVTDQAAAEVAAKQAAAKAAAKAAAVATEVADKAEAASEKADAAERAATKAAAEKQAAAKAAAEAAEKTELEAEAREVQAAQEAAEKKKAVEAATARLKAAEAKEVEQEATVRLYEKALDFEKKQDEAARKLASQADMTAGLVPQYDPITSTESLYKDTPQSALQYSTVPKHIALLPPTHQYSPCANPHACLCRGCHLERCSRATPVPWARVGKAQGQGRHRGDCRP